MGIGSILGMIAAGAAAPFTGGTSLAILPSLMEAGGNVADVLGGASRGAQTQNNTTDTLKLALANAGLNRDKFALDAPATRLSTGSNAALKAALASAGPSKINWGGPGSGLRGEIPTMSGGIHDAIGSLKNNPNYMSLLDMVGKDSLAAEKRGGASGGNQDAATPSILDGVGQSSGLDKLLGGAAFGSSILGALKPNPNRGLFGGNTTYGSSYNPNDFQGIDPETGMPFMNPSDEEGLG